MRRFARRKLGEIDCPTHTEEGLMKRTTKHTPATVTSDRRPDHTRVLTDADLAQVSGGDIYMQNPKGSNNPVGGGTGG
jgi:hypothetical protein